IHRSHTHLSKIFKMHDCILNGNFFSLHPGSASYNNKEGKSYFFVEKYANLGEFIGLPEFLLREINVLLIKRTWVGGRQTVLLMTGPVSALSPASQIP
uniref:Uncharacterized protein n=1 Tax=Cyclopterus lumpus TaxID=8103 RepID=A0A8C2XSM8_CYCLU